jgi:hypothetical protein
MSRAFSPKDLPAPTRSPTAVALTLTLNEGKRKNPDAARIPATARTFLPKIPASPPTIIPTNLSTPNPETFDAHQCTHPRQINLNQWVDACASQYPGTES